MSLKGMIDSLEPEKRELILQMYSTVTQVISKVSPGAIIEPSTEGNAYCNIIKTPNNILQVCDMDTPRMLCALFQTMFPQLRGEAILIDAVKFSEKHSKSYYRFLKINSANPSFISTISKYRTAISTAPTKDALFSIYKELAEKLQAFAIQASPRSRFSVTQQADVVSTVLYTPSRAMMCDHITEIVPVLMVICPTTESDLILCMELANQFGEMLQDLNILVHKNKNEPVIQKLRYVN